MASSAWALGLAFSLVPVHVPGRITTARMPVKIASSATSATASDAPTRTRLEDVLSVAGKAASHVAESRDRPGRAAPLEVEQERVARSARFVQGVERHARW